MKDQQGWDETVKYSTTLQTEQKFNADRFSLSGNRGGWVPKVIRNIWPYHKARNLEPYHLAHLRWFLQVGKKLSYYISIFFIRKREDC